VVGSGTAAGASVYSTFIFTESHKSHRIRQAKRDFAEEDYELRVGAVFHNGMIFYVPCRPWSALLLRRFSRRSNAANAQR
jgi:hypothetical protein